MKKNIIFLIAAFIIINPCYGLTINNKSGQFIQVVGCIAHYSLGGDYSPWVKDQAIAWSEVYHYNCAPNETIEVDPTHIDEIHFFSFDRISPNGLGIVQQNRSLGRLYGSCESFEYKKKYAEIYGSMLEINVTDNETIESGLALSTKVIVKNKIKAGAPSLAHADGIINIINGYAGTFPLQQAKNQYCTIL